MATDTEIVYLEDEYMTLTQLLKTVGAVSTGGEVKWFLQDIVVTVNGEPEARRGKKLYAGDIVSVADIGTFHIRAKG
jgi:ribosome-associated protein